MSCKDIKDFRKSVYSLLNELLNRPQQELERILDGVMFEVDDAMDDLIKSSTDSVTDLTNDSLLGKAINCSVSANLSNLKSMVNSKLDDVFNAQQIISDSPIGDLQKDIAHVIGLTKQDNPTEIVKELTRIWNLYKHVDSQLLNLCNIVDEIRKGKDDICSIVPKIIITKDGKFKIRKTQAILRIEEAIENIDIPGINIDIPKANKKNIVTNFNPSNKPDISELIDFNSL